MAAKRFSPVFDVLIKGQPQGNIWRERGIWRWHIYRYKRSATMQHVIDDIIRLYRVHPLHVNVVLRDPKIRKEVEARAQDVIEKVLDGTDTDRIRKMIVDAMYWARNA